jgi:hypothetical protein
MNTFRIHTDTYIVSTIYMPMYEYVYMCICRSCRCICMYIHIWIPWCASPSWTESVCSLWPIITKENSWVGQVTSGMFKSGVEQPVHYRMELGGLKLSVPPASIFLKILNMLIDTDSLKYRQIPQDMHNTYRYMPYCQYSYTYAHFTLNHFSSIYEHGNQYTYRYRQIYTQYIQIHAILQAYMHICTFHTSTFFCNF